MAKSTAEEFVMFELVAKPRIQGFLKWMEDAGVSEEEQNQVCALILKYEPGLKLADEATTSAEQG